MAIRIKLSKPGFNVLTTGNENLSFSDELATHSIYAVVDITKGTGVTSVTHTHSLGFVPKVWVFVEQTDGDGDHFRRVPVSLSFGERIDYKITSTTVVIEADLSGVAYDLKLVIFTRSPNP